MKIYLDYDDAPNPADRETARLIIEDIITNSVLTTGTFCLEGYAAARRIAKALTAARTDERRIGFDTRREASRWRRYGASPRVRVASSGPGLSPTR